MVTFTQKTGFKRALFWRCSLFGCVLGGTVLYLLSRIFFFCYPPPVWRITRCAVMALVIKPSECFGLWFCWNSLGALFCGSVAWNKIVMQIMEWNITKHQRGQSGGKKRSWRLSLVGWTCDWGVGDVESKPGGNQFDVFLRGGKNISFYITPWNLTKNDPPVIV